MPTSNADLKLKPGLTANVNIFTMEYPDMLSVPTKALRFTPTKDLLAPGEKIEDCQAPQKVWVREGQTIKAHAVKTGITNGTLTQVVSGVKEGTQVITGVSTAMPDGPAADEQEKSPFAPGPRKKTKK